MLAVLTAVLVIITGYYAWQTRAMVTEMRRGRMLSLLPSLAIDLELLGAVYPLVVLRNVGAGAALDVDLVLTFVGSADAETETRPWKTRVIPAGQRHEFKPPREIRDLKTLARRFPTVRLEGTFKDVFGQSRALDEELDIVRVLEVTFLAEERYQRPAADQIAAELKVIASALAAVDKSLVRIAGAAASKPPPPPGSGQDSTPE